MYNLGCKALTPDESRIKVFDFVLKYPQLNFMEKFIKNLVFLKSLF